MKGDKVLMLVVAFLLGYFMRQMCNGKTIVVEGANGGLDEMDHICNPFTIEICYMLYPIISIGDYFLFSRELKQKKRKTKDK